jgi:N-acetylglucosamine-6-phosphate deacetylase
MSSKNSLSSSGKLIKFKNCRILRDHKIVREYLWVRDKKIINPEKIFFDEKKSAHITIDCNNAIIAPGFIELQINGKHPLIYYFM